MMPSRVLRFAFVFTLGLAPAIACAQNVGLDSFTQDVTPE
jgi:hypothetical protein